MIDIKSVQILAIDSIEHPNWESVYRNICRWYSKEFCTPLHVVENDLEEREVVRHYYEELFNRLYNLPEKEGQSKYKEVRDKLLFEEEYKAREELDDELLEQMMEEETEKMAKENGQLGQNSGQKNIPNPAQNPNIIDEELNLHFPGEK